MTETMTKVIIHRVEKCGKYTKVVRFLRWELSEVKFSPVGDIPWSDWAFVVHKQIEESARQSLEKIITGLIEFLGVD